MFDERKKRRELQRNITLLREGQKEGADLQSLYPLLTTDESNKPLVISASATPRNINDQLVLSQELGYREMELERFESNLLINEARKLAIKIPSEHSDWWIEDKGNVPVTRWLSLTGQLGVSKLIKDERRKSIEWWVKIITPLLGALISILGLIVALVSISRK
jgi:hypothetical protein